MSVEKIKIQEHVKAELERLSKNIGVDASNIDPDENVIESGLIDSFGFLELLMSVEQKFGAKINFMELDPGDFTSLNGLIFHVSKALEIEVEV